MNDQQIAVQMTQQGYDELVAERDELQNQKIPTAIDRVALARSFGDLSENAEYHAAREDLAMLQGRLEELEELINRSQVIQASKNGTVALGSKVILQLADKKGDHVYMVVGEWEADPTERKISEKSPLGTALLGKTKGEKIEIEAPAGKVVYTIVDVQ